MWYYIFKYILLGPILQAIGRPRVEGLDNIPDDGPVILASNHQAVFDSFYLVLVVKRRITFLAKSEYFTGRGPKGRFQRWFFSSAGQVPIDRTGASAAQDALDAGLRVLGDGKLLGIYPEGTRSPDVRLYKGKTGLARLALESGVPVIPVAMIGTAKMNPIGSRFPRPAKVGVKIGKPLDFSRYEGMAGNRFVERAVTDEVMYELMKLSGQQYVDVYAASMKETPTVAVDPAPPTEAARIPDTRAG
ncbi:1-acyl-sn-glycerol-3-phosphate acyltransferase [Rhodococcus sp. BP-349]|uniref:lysophospholipid acyltransferase family protein n=1 Tax=unclassified Rhodococcus (in: high G+C Gram-positive bacteria) TaxID=192944 RepID=UPI001C9AB753|nr:MULTISPECIES: lysophospholipid acyltransferase family protein [unclassified Rhodococcus (in: high G+C Gram-positive bacteria)]MBY6540719.1 1-acyl-sn-glycerol-3-phosphate acyltransferase [Rhodococcus sp. BP-363]MBY6545255.1 1-acyl-sn-glycerol-3-phosphate acyltransferase [Rhodococcus sp. BP-369]MBY6564485.1 1-acyl-sn-glycerol-3-phosphate acyltransferase [Rhodococcus sp. BP-370]MBY6578578.1 1-acyl-sn-glycerol-3-phosphate acyltransferase [Rhodococcus sp. BP-364]MBY6587879.1 1-acyl-sn-glycerol-3